MTTEAGIISSLYPLGLLGNAQADQLYPMSFVVVPAWIVLMTAPRWKYTRTITFIPPFLLGVVYFLGILSLRSYEFLKDPTTLEAMTKSFSDPTIVCLGWVHYLVFDLMVGRMMAFDAIDVRKVSAHQWYAILCPCLFFTFLLGPIGWVWYEVASHTILHSPPSPTNRTIQKLEPTDHAT